ncbi:MAG: hypothetical protein GWN58_57300, partial [Anaerolineae bacterium]|nr:hypothetical protein [Anaerolineae bacterium]
MALPLSKGDCTRWFGPAGLRMFNKAWINLAILLVPIALIFDAPALLVISAFLITSVTLAWWWTRSS